MSAEASAHGSQKCGIAALVSMTGNSGGTISIEAHDTKKDGHCAYGRLYRNGQWQRVATDCNHTDGRGVSSREYTQPIGSTISVSVCVGSHVGNSWCHYRQFTIPNLVPHQGRSAWINPKAIPGPYHVCIDGPV